MKRFAGLALFCVVGCGSDPANVEGNFTIAVTSRDNGCNLANWTVGNQAAGIQVTIAQEGEDVSATIEGLVGAYVTAALGSNMYNGTIDGESLDLALFGSRNQASGNCAFTYNSYIRGSVNGDTLTGRIDYTAATNGNPDCAAIEGCISYQDFNGTRPPQ